MTIDITAVGHDIAQAYLATWNATDPGERRELLARHWAPEVTYVDPMAVGQDRDEVGAIMASVHEQFPTFVFTLVGEVDAHHDQARFQWGLGPAQADPVVIGFDVVVVDRDRRIVDVRGFLDLAPS